MKRNKTKTKNQTLLGTLESVKSKKSWESSCHSLESGIHIFKSNRSLVWESLPLVVSEQQVNLCESKALHRAL